MYMKHICFWNKATFSSLMWKLRFILLSRNNVPSSKKNSNEIVETVKRSLKSEYFCKFKLKKQWISTKHNSANQYLRRYVKFHITSHIYITPFFLGLSEKIKPSSGNEDFSKYTNSFQSVLIETNWTSTQH